MGEETGCVRRPHVNNYIAWADRTLHTYLPSIYSLSWFLENLINACAIDKIDCKTVRMNEARSVWHITIAIESLPYSILICYATSKNESILQRRSSMLSHTRIMIILYCTSLHSSSIKASFSWRLRRPREQQHSLGKPSENMAENLASSLYSHSLCTLSLPHVSNWQTSSRHPLNLLPRDPS